jgi:hypothetical protein
MQFLGVPSLLLLPGVLTVLTCLAGYSLATWTKAPDWKAPGLLVLAVTLSSIYALKYPYITKHVLSERRDYLRGYALQDVAYIWGGSIVVGLVAGLGGAGMFWLAEGVRRCRARKLQPTPGESPIEVLPSSVAIGLISGYAWSRSALMDRASPRPKRRYYWHCRLA